MEKQIQKIKQISLAYYARKDIQKAILEFSKKREVIPRYFEKFGKRPDTLQYESDILNLVKKGATSFHASEEIWKDPLQISTDMLDEQLNKIREGWDLVVDIDSKYIDYSKIAALLLVQALEFHGVQNYSIKFSGSKGFHVLVPWKSFPKKINNIETKNMFPEWPRAILSYLSKFIEKKLIDNISEMMNENLKYKSASKYIKGDEQVGDAVKKVVPDIILVSSRHLFRAPYSLHEKTALSSIVLTKDELENFQPKHADPFKVKIRKFYPEARENEARELLIQALDWQERTEKQIKQSNYKYKEIKIDKNKIVHPPCINNILKANLTDGRKRALFILTNYLRSINLEREDVEKIIEDWNKKNKKPLQQGYIKSQFNWQYRQKKLMPPNCSRDWYKGIGICNPDELCKSITNPVNYAVKKAFLGKKLKISKNKK